jgi:hypothetical protein
MSRNQGIYSIVNIEGEVMIYDREHGWEKARSGMVFPKDSNVTIKTGRTGRAVIVNESGEFIVMTESSMLELNSDLIGCNEVDTLRQIKLTPSGMQRARWAVRRLMPAA